MSWIRYLLYFVAIALVTWMMTQLEISSPGSLKLHVIVYEGDRLGTSEFSPIEIVQPLILGICGLLMLWVAKHCPSQRPLAIPFAGCFKSNLLSSFWNYVRNLYSLQKKNLKSLEKRLLMGQLMLNYLNC